MQSQNGGKRAIASRNMSGMEQVHHALSLSEEPQRFEMSSLLQSNKMHRDKNMSDKKTNNGDKKTPVASKSPNDAHQQVRKKLREMYGDDTAETVRRFLTDLIREDGLSPEDGLNPKDGLSPDDDSGSPN
jgi:hypothetical protein